MQHFISESNWNARAPIDQVARKVSSVLPKRKFTGLITDEGGWVKKGEKSVGVGPQYCGNVGKIASEYIKTLRADNWQTLKVRNTTKGVLIGQYHFVKVFIWNKGSNLIEPRMPLLSARDIKEMVVFELFRQMTKEDMTDRILNRHLLRLRIHPKIL